MRNNFSSPQNGNGNSFRRRGDNGHGAEAPAAETESFEGVIDHVVFHNSGNGYTVAKFEVLDTGDKIPITGTFANLSEGQPMKIHGEWVTHPKYGKQFKVARYEVDLPRSKVGMIKFLSSFIKGVGPVMAKRIVDKFGEETVEIIDKSPQRIREVPGIGKRKADEIIKSWEEHRRIKSVMLFLQSHNIPQGVAMKIFTAYGDDSIRVLKENPYLLATEVYGVGFKTADRVAMNLGMDKDSPLRINAGLVYTLETAGSEGHIYLPVEELVTSASKILEVTDVKVEEALASMMKSGDRIITENDRVYAPNYHYAECYIAKRMAAILKEKSRTLFNLGVEEKEIRSAEEALGFRLSNQQLSVVEELGREKVVILTGGPGTGKTVSTRAVIHIFKNNGFRVLLAAPTGRAAKRMTEATGEQSKTIHRLLEYNPRGNIFNKDNENPLECDLLVIDEMSMVDTLLMYHLIKAVKHHTRLLFVGDIDQLPSVGPGNVLRDLIDSGAAKTVRLETIYRQGAESTIVGNAHLINRGEMPVMATAERGGNFYFSHEEDPEKAMEILVRICLDKIPKKFNLDPIADIQVISPMYNGMLGVDKLNEVLQARLNPGKDISCGSRRFRIGDRVMQIKNNYEKEVFNGDVGFIRSIDIAQNQLVVDYLDNKVNYLFGETDQLVLAYAITVHKSQGSEYKAVVMPVHTQHYVMLQRNLIYTGITRAKEMVVLVGTKKAVAIAVKNNKIESRYTSLAERIVREMQAKTIFDREREDSDA